MRSGRTHFSPAAPFKLVWYNKYFDEGISTEVEPIIAEGKTFFGTLKGVFYALNAETGETEWKKTATGGVRHAASYADGIIVYATLGDQSGGSVVARKAKDGEELWSHKTARGGFVNNPLLYDGAVYIGDRLGNLWALELKSGKVLWSHKFDAPFLQSCAARDGIVCVAAEDMIPRAFDAKTGKALWTGKRMDGDSVRFYYPVFWKDTVIWRTPAGEYEIPRIQSRVQEATEDGKEWTEMKNKHGWSKEYYEAENAWHKRYTPEKHEVEQKVIREYIQDGKIMRTFYMLKVSDGTDKMFTSIPYAGSENGYSVPTPAPIDFDGNLYVLYKSIYSQWTYPIRFFDSIGILDYKSGLPEMLERAEPARKGYFPITADEVNMFTVGGNKLYNTHDHNFVYYDMDKKKVIFAFAPKSHQETWGGILVTHQGGQYYGEKDFRVVDDMFPLEGTRHGLTTYNEWNGTACGSVAIWKDKVYWRTGNMIICLRGTVE